MENNKLLSESVNDRLHGLLFFHNSDFPDVPLFEACLQYGFTENLNLTAANS